MFSRVRIQLSPFQALKHDFRKAGRRTHAVSLARLLPSVWCTRGFTSGGRYEMDSSINVGSTPSFDCCFR